MSFKNILISSVSFLIVFVAFSLSSMEEDTRIRTLGNDTSISIVSLGHCEDKEELSSPKGLGDGLIKTCKSGELPGVAGQEVIKDYLKKGPDLMMCDEQGSALMWLAFRGKLDLMKLLIKKNPECINARSNLEYTAVHAAAQKGHNDILVYLEQNKANVKAKTIDGSTALHLAAQANRGSTVVYLKDKIKLDARDSFGRTALHLAACKGHAHLCTVLIRYGARANAQAEGGFTPLHAAAFNGRLTVVKQLLAFGADPQIKDDEGLTACDHAIKGGYEDIARCIKSAIEKKVTAQQNKENRKPLATLYDSK